MVIHILHRKSAIDTDKGGSLLPGEEGLVDSDEITPVEETITAVHTDEGAAQAERARLNAKAAEAQQERYHEVLDADPWTVTSMVVDEPEGTTETTGV